ncbi:MAG: glycosyltransferase [Candidatus Omnitrophica bacterium]|nr:glycosyltransferase [Candidatus Omnitrophota bacterium]
MLPKVSIIVPVYNGEKTLSLCLDSLMNLNYPKEKLEIIVVDNNSTDGTKDITKRYSVKYVFENKKGEFTARNAGTKSSSGEFIAFTDADCIVDKDWIERLIKGFDSNDIAGCGGKVLSYQPKTWAEKYVDSDNRFSQENYIMGKTSWLPWAGAGNVIYRRKILDEIDLFDRRFITSGDADLSWRVLLKGYQIRYVPEAVIWHKRRDTLTPLCKQFFGYGIGRAQSFKKYHKLNKSSFLFLGISIGKPSFLGILIELSTFLGMLYGLIGWKLGKISPLKSTQFANKIIWWWQDKNVIILNLSKVVYYCLEGVGARMWELYQKGEDTGKISSIIAEEYNENQEKVREDLISLLNKFKEEGLLEK